MSKRTKNQEPSTKNSAATPLVIPITELDLPEFIIDHLVEQGIKTLGDLIEFSRDPEAMEAVLESGSRQQVLSLVATYDQEPDQADSSANEIEPEAKQGPPAKLGKKQESKATRETPSSLQSPASSLTDDDLVQNTDAQLRRDFLAQVKHKAASETDERLARMLTRAKVDDDYYIVRIINAEIDKRFEATRNKQMCCTIELNYSDLQRRGYSASEESVSRFLHRQRLTHEAGVALARIHLAMKEGGVKLRNGKRVTSKSHVIQKLLELAYDGMVTEDQGKDRKRT
jgi:hypothetical protein